MSATTTTNGTRNTMQQLVVTGLQGKRDVLLVPKTCSIEQLFTEVIKTSAQGVSADELRLVYGGSELERGKGHTIATYDIPQMAQIFMVIRLRGGGRGGGGGGLLGVGGGGGGLPPLPLRPISWSLVCGGDDVISTTYDPDVITFECDYSSAARLKMPCGHAIGAETLLTYCTNIVDAGKLLFSCPSCSSDWNYAFIRKALQVKGQSVVSLDCKVTENSFRVIPGFQKCPASCCSVWLYRDPAESSSSSRSTTTSSSTSSTSSSSCVRCPVCSKVFCWSCLRPQSTSSATTGGGGGGGGGQCGYSDCADGGGAKGVAEDDPRIRFLKTQPLKTIGLVSGCPSVRGCERCGTLLEHRDACKHMVCKSCKLQFCFVCLKPYNVATGQWQCGAHNAVCAVAPQQSTLPDMMTMMMTSK